MYQTYQFQSTLTWHKYRHTYMLMRVEGQRSSNEQIHNVANFLLDSYQGCILMTYLSVISSKVVQKFAQKCQYFTLIDQSVPLDNFYITFFLRTNPLWPLSSEIFNLPPFRFLLCKARQSFGQWSKLQRVTILIQSFRKLLCKSDQEQR